MRWETDLLNVGNGHRKKRDEVGNGRYEVRNGRTRWETDMRVCICTYFKDGWYLQPMASLVNAKCPISPDIKVRKPILLFVQTFSPNNACNF